MTKIRTLNPALPPIPISSSETIILPHTPKKPKDVAMEEKTIIQRMNNNEEITPERMRRFIKGSVANANLLELTQRDLQTTHTAALAKRARKKLAGTVVQKGGIVTARDVRHNHLHRTQEEVERRRVVKSVLRRLDKRKYFSMEKRKLNGLAWWVKRPKAG